MKKAIIGIALVFIALITFAFTSSDNAPEAVKKAFAKKFPTAKKVAWEKESDTEWEAEFKMDKVEYSANFLNDGTWQETEHEIKKSEIPQQVLSSLETNFPDFEIEEAEISEKAAGTFYEFEIEKVKTEWEVTLDATGKILKKENEKEGDKD